MGRGDVLVNARSLLTVAVALLLTVGLTGCLGSLDDGRGASSGAEVEPGCSQQQVSGQLTPESSLTAEAAAQADGARAQVDIDHVGQGEITFVLEQEGEEVWRDSITQPLLRTTKTASDLPAGDYTLTASVDQGVHQVNGLWLNITWGGASC